MIRGRQLPPEQVVDSQVSLLARDPAARSRREVNV
jgi:hypothetical protein